MSHHEVTIEAESTVDEDFVMCRTQYSRKPSGQVIGVNVKEKERKEMRRERKERRQGEEERERMERKRVKLK